MIRDQRRLILACVLTLPALRPAYSQTAEPPRASSPAAIEGRPAVIERTPLTIRPAELYQIPLQLQPVRTLTISPRRDGVVATLHAKLGDKVQSGAEVARMETQERQLELTRAQAGYKAALAEQSQGEAAAARVEVAKADLDLAQLRLEQCNLKTLLTGVIIAVHVTEGQFVQAGQPVMTIIDPSQLRVEVPVDGRTSAAGGSVELKIEDATASATLQAVVPLRPQFEPLRDLFVSVATGVASIDNSGGKFQAGQTVFSPLIPRQPVAEVPTAALSNTGAGQRKVQVIREGFIRDVVVQPLGQIGDDHVFVAGRFGAGDELVLKSTEPLLDGARVVPQGDSAGAAGQGMPAPGGTRKGSNF
ncbi:MAG: HlyD family efflux transporter periplasmic adaptor subunit [Planctomyces sp.]|nr:HlyD family efflux transporter periplasmic adaptor subunit [Planctomyces sp.]